MKKNKLFCLCKVECPYDSRLKGQCYYNNSCFHKSVFPKNDVKDEHDEYLKAIGYEKYVKDLEYFKDVHVGLYVIDKIIDDIFTDNPEEKDCKTVVEAFLIQQFKKLKSLMWRI